MLKGKIYWFFEAIFRRESVFSALTGDIFCVKAATFTAI